MKSKKLYLAIQTVLCVLLCSLLCASAIGIYREGAAARTSGDPTTPIFTREKIAERLTPVLPLLLAAILSTLAGRLLPLRASQSENSVQKPENGRDLVCAQITAPTAAIRAALLAAAVAFIAAGILNGGMRDVLFKAINICTECVGLG